MTKREYYSSGVICFIAIILWFQTAAYGYEVGTHAEMSNRAAQQSSNLSDVLPNIGLETIRDTLTSSGGLSCSGTSTQSVLNWIKEGSICEDDTFSQTFARYRNHFYDPINGNGFGGILWPNSGILSGMPAPDWAIGPADGQLYSFSQGRQYFFDGLTKASETERKDNLARMFRTLGDVIHLVQDMGQPQHTRNDGHGFPKSAYEVYTDNKRESGELIYTGAPIPTFGTAREYLTDLAQFSNNNFVSVGTNFQLFGGQAVPGVGYSLPIPGTATEVPVQALNPPVSTDILVRCGTNTACNMTFYSTNQSVFNERASALSIFDQYVSEPGSRLRPVIYTDPRTSTTYQVDRIFTLNLYTYNSAHPFLIPRAVSYSAGMLDYFFRGKLDVAQDTTIPGTFAIKNTGTENMSGTFSLYYDDASGARNLVYTAPAPLSIPANGQSGPLSFTPPPAAKSTDKYMLVFKGDMGQETQTAVVAKAVTLNTGCSASDSPAGGTLKFTNGGKRTVASVTKTNGFPYDPVQGANEMYSVEGTAPFKVAKRVINGVVSQDPMNWLYLSGSAPPSIKLATDNGATPITYTGNRGDDKAAFTLNADTLTFNVAPDFEAPIDKGANNTYETCVRAIDGANETGFENVTAEVKYFYNVTRVSPVFDIKKTIWTGQYVTYEFLGTFSGEYDELLKQYTTGAVASWIQAWATATYSQYPPPILLEEFIRPQDFGGNLVQKFLINGVINYFPSGEASYPGWSSLYNPGPYLGSYTFTQLEDADDGQQYLSEIINGRRRTTYTIITGSKIWPLAQ